MIQQHAAAEYPYRKKRPVWVRMILSGGFADPDFAPAGRRDVATGGGSRQAIRNPWKAAPHQLLPREGQRSFLLHTIPLPGSTELVEVRRGRKRYAIGTTGCASPLRVVRSTRGYHPTPRRG